MSTSSSDAQDAIEKKIQGLIARSEGRHCPATRKLLSHLEQVETALSQGVLRKELAETFGLSVTQFATALSGARHLAKQGGDGRMLKRNSTSTVGARPGQSSLTQPERGQLVKPFGAK